MPDRDFDKSIQRKANELRLEPSPEIWERVAAQIQDKDRKRGFAWIWLAAAMIAGGLAVWFFGPSLFNEADSAKNQVAKQVPSKPETNALPSQQNVDSKQPFSENSANESTSTLESTNNSAASASNSLISTSKNRTGGESISSGSGLVKGSASKRKTGSSSAYKEGVAVSPQYTVHSERIVSGAALVAETEEPELFGRSIANSLNQPERTGVQDNKATEGDTRLAASLLESPPLEPEKTKQGWDLAFQVGGGSGSMREGISHSYAPRYEYMASPNNGFSPAPSVAAPLDPRPSKVKAGPSFQASIGISKPIGRKTSFITGLQYAYFSNRIEVGQKIDSSAISSNFRLQSSNGTGTLAYTGAGNDGSAYYNAYHYLQIPLEIGWALDNRNRLSWNNGLLIGYLLSTDALHYDDMAGAYYKDNNLINKWQTSAQTSLQYRLFPGHKWNLSVGPYLNYQLRNIDKTPDAKRLLTVGLNARLLFNKSK